jgi:hypothetical protein
MNVGERRAAVTIGLIEQSNACVVFFIYAAFTQFPRAA